jgi:transglutaminase-like putative cysteine protease
VDGRYVVIARGRDYSDVPPLKGVIFTNSKTSTLKVAVDVAPIQVTATESAGPIAVVSPDPLTELDL